MVRIIIVYRIILEDNVDPQSVPVNTKGIRKLDPFYIGYVWHGLTTIVARNHLHCCEGDRGGRGRRPSLHCRRQGRGIHSGTVRLQHNVTFLRIFTKKLRILWHIPYYLYLIPTKVSNPMNFSLQSTKEIFNELGNVILPSVQEVVTHFI